MAPARVDPPPQLGLTWLDKLAATAFVDCAETGPGPLIKVICESAQSLIGDDRDAARIRLLAREIAMVKASLDLITASIGERLRANDERGALLADRLARSATRRLTMLCAEHRAAGAVERRSTIVAVAHADAVHVDTGE